MCEGPELLILECLAHSLLERVPHWSETSPSKLAVQQAPPPSHHHWDYKHAAKGLAFCLASGDLCSGHHAGEASVLLTEWLPLVFGDTQAGLQLNM